MGTKPPTRTFLFQLFRPRPVETQPVQFMTYFVCSFQPPGKYSESSLASRNSILRVLDEYIYITILEERISWVGQYAWHWAFLFLRNDHMHFTKLNKKLKTKQKLIKKTINKQKYKQVHLQKYFTIILAKHFLKLLLIF